MEALKHTKGNWRSNRTNVFIECQNPAELKHIATTFEYHGMNDYRTHIVTLEEAEANAKLICAAPDMLEILLLLDEFMNYAPKEIREMRYKAIEKAINGNVPDFCKTWPIDKTE